MVAPGSEYLKIEKNIRVRSSADDNTRFWEVEKRQQQQVSEVIFLLFKIAAYGVSEKQAPPLLKWRKFKQKTFLLHVARISSSKM